MGSSISAHVLRRERGYWTYVRDSVPSPGSLRPSTRHPGPFTLQPALSLYPRPGNQPSTAGGAWPPGLQRTQYPPPLGQLQNQVPRSQHDSPFQQRTTEPHSKNKTGTGAGPGTGVLSTQRHPAGAKPSEVADPPSVSGPDPSPLASSQLRHLPALPLMTGGLPANPPLSTIPEESTSAHATSAARRSASASPRPPSADGRGRPRTRSFKDPHAERPFSETPRSHSRDRPESRSLRTLPTQRRASSALPSVTGHGAHVRTGNLNEVHKNGKLFFLFQQKPGADWTRMSGLVQYHIEYCFWPGDAPTVQGAWLGKVLDCNTYGQSFVWDDEELLLDGLRSSFAQNGCKEVLVQGEATKEAHGKQRVSLPHARWQKKVSRPLEGSATRSSSSDIAIKPEDIGLTIEQAYRLSLNSSLWCSHLGITVLLRCHLVNETRPLRWTACKAEYLQLGDYSTASGRRLHWRTPPEGCTFEFEKDEIQSDLKTFFRSGNARDNNVRTIIVAATFHARVIGMAKGRINADRANYVIHFRNLNLGNVPDKLKTRSSPVSRAGRPPAAIQEQPRHQVATVRLTPRDLDEGIKAFYGDHLLTSQNFFNYIAPYRLLLEITRKSETGVELLDQYSVSYLHRVIIWDMPDSSTRVYRWTAATPTHYPWNCIDKDSLSRLLRNGTLNGIPVGTSFLQTATIRFQRIEGREGSVQNKATPVCAGQYKLVIPGFSTPEDVSGTEKAVLDKYNADFDDGGILLRGIK